MSERHIPQPSPQERPATWDPERLAAALDATVAPTQDLALGPGYRLSLPDQPTHIDLFPSGRAAQIVASDGRMMLIVADQEPPLIETAGIVFSRPGRSLSIAASGEIQLAYHPERASDAVEAPETPPTTANWLDGQDGPEPPVVDDDVTSQTQLAPVPADPEASPTPESERIRLMGRLGANPSFRTTRNGILIGTFPLAVRIDEDTTDWHTVRAFKDRAEQLRDIDLKKGQFAEVIGYRHQRERKTRDGQTKLVEEIYAVVVKPR